jgi:hypothetical protein
VPGTPFGGGRAVLAKGVMVVSVHAASNYGSGGWNDVTVELKVDPAEVQAIDNLMDGLTQIINGTHPSQNFSTMTSIIVSPGTVPAGQWVDEETLDEIEGEMERDPEDIEDLVTLVTLKKLIEERMDDIDSALRLVVGE